MTALTQREYSRAWRERHGAVELAAIREARRSARRARAALALRPFGISIEDVADISTAFRLFEKVRISEDGHWIWIGARSGGHLQYGAASYRGRLTTAHRAVYSLLRGDVDPGLECDHKCRVTLCVNPDHIEAVTPGENQRRARQARQAEEAQV